MRAKVKVGFIGAGTVGQMHLSHWSKIPACEIKALAELRPQLRNIVADKFAIPNVYDSHTELIANPDIDAVVVVTRRHNTAAVVSGCLQAGKHVFSEKPMAKTAQQAEELAQIAKSLGLEYAIGYQRRHDAGTQIAKKTFDQLLKSNELGAITFVRSWNFTGQDRNFDTDHLMTKEPRPDGLQWTQTPPWLSKEHEMSYDRFINVCCHDINMLRHFLGRRPKVQFANLDHKLGWIIVFDFGQCIATLDGGFNELNDGGKPSAWDEGLEIIFEKGRLYVKFSPPLIHNLCSRVELRLSSGETKVLCDGHSHTAAFQLQAENFLQSVLSKQKLLASGLDAAEDLEIIQEVWQKYLAL